MTRILILYYFGDYFATALLFIYQDINMRNYTTKWHLNIFCNRYVFYISLLLEYGKISVLYKFFHFVYVSVYKCILCIIQHTLLVILVNTIMTSQKLLYLELTKYSVWPIWTSCHDAILVIARRAHYIKTIYTYII